jgi:poly(ADP-ribose) glycohydrolase ARH3
MNKLLSRFTGCLLGVAIGDSLGARREGTTGIGGETADLAPRYTDDTAMTLGVAESLIEHKEFHYWHMAGRLIKNYEQEPWRRYGHTVTRVFRMLRNGKLGFGMLDRELYPEGSFGNGAAMRIAPVGLLYHDDPRTLRDIAFHCASITHSHYLGLEGAVLQACAVALAILTTQDDLNSSEFLGALRMITNAAPYQDKLRTITDLLAMHPTRERVIAALGNGESSLESVPAAIYSFLATTDFKSAVLSAVGLGGDADTIGSMTGALAGALYGVEGIPSQWREAVENREMIERTARELWEVKTDRREAAETPAGVS